MQFRRNRFGWGAILLAVVMLGTAVMVLDLLIVKRIFHGPGKSRKTSVPAPPPSKLVVNPGGESQPPSPAATSKDSLRECLASLKATSSADVARRSLAELGGRLASLPSAAASKIIRELLDSKEDAQTQLKFMVGADGLLTESPSLRTFLLDQLARIDPAAAAAYAEKILSTMSSADEWAVALRSYAQGNGTGAGKAFLEQKMQALLGYEPWQKEPSAGYLESFDVAVHLGGTSLMPALTTLVRKMDNQAVAHAAFLALDRLAIADPVPTLNKLQSEPELMSGREVTRANYFARADAGDAQQKTVLENYLLSPQLTAAELTTFAGLYPNANYMISHNLLTRTQTPDHDTLVRRDRAALQTVEGWLADPRFEKRKPQLETMKSRLEMFVKQAQ